MTGHEIDLSTAAQAFEAPTNRSSVGQLPASVDIPEVDGIEGSQFSTNTSDNNMDSDEVDDTAKVAADIPQIEQTQLENQRENAGQESEHFCYEIVPTLLPLSFDQNADVHGFIEKEALRRLREVYGDHVHDNDGTHLHGNLLPGEDEKWQRWWKDLVSSPLSSYALPKGHTGKRFLQILIKEFRNVRVEHITNSERIIVYMNVVLEHCPTVKKPVISNVGLNRDSIFGNKESFMRWLIIPQRND